MMSSTTLHLASIPFWACGALFAAFALSAAGHNHMRHALFDLAISLIFQGVALILMAM